MTYPVQQPGYAPQGYEQPAAPQYPQQGYPAQQPGFPMAPPQQYAPQQPGYPMAPQGYPQVPQQPTPQLASGTLDAFYSQPSSGGGAALKFEQPGATHVGIVARPITNGDIQQQTVVGSNAPAFFKDGRPKFVMKVPLQVQPSPAHPDGLAQWFCAGQARDDLVRAMAAVGAPEGPPEAGAVIQITMTGTRSAGAGMNPAKVYQVVYQRPNGAAPAAPPAAPAPIAQAPAPNAALNEQAPHPATWPAGDASGLPLAPPVQQFQQPVAQVPIQQSAPVAQQAPPPPAPPAAAPVAGMDPEKAALLARLTGQTAPAAG